MAHWTSYIGLPHVLGADPANGVGADCLILAFAVLGELGMGHPPLDPEWFVMAERGDWAGLRRLWEELTDPLEGPEEGAVTLMGDEQAGLGVAIVIDGGLLIVHHRRGVTWVSLQFAKKLNYRKFRE